MTLPPDRERVRQILSETIGLLCRNGLSFDCELSVDALIGITVDRKDVFLISIKDTYDSEKNLQPSCGSTNVTAAQFLRDCSQKSSCSELDSALKCDFPSSVTNDGSAADKNLSFEKQTTSNKFLSTQSCKRMLERNEYLEDQTKRSRISVGTNMEASQEELMPLAVVKLEPCESLLAADYSGTTSCSKSHNSSTSHEPRSSGLVSLVNSKLNSVIDSVRLRVRTASHSDVSTGKVSDVFSITKDRNSENVSSICLRQDKNTEVGSELTNDCNDDFSSFDRQNISRIDSDYPEANSRSKEQSSQLPSSIHTQDTNAAAPRCNLKVASTCNSSQLILKRSEGSSDGRALESASDPTKSQRIIHRRKSNEICYESYVDCASSDSEVICIKEEAPCIPFNSNALFLINPRPSLQSEGDRLTEVALTQHSVNSLNFDSLPRDHSVGWKSIQNNFYHHVRRQQKEAWSTWSHDNGMPSSFMDTQSMDKQLKQAAQSILLYDGQYVPLRDIQRLRLCGMAAGQIRLAMEQLSSYDGKLGCFQMLHGGVNLFYKCPPTLVDREVLESTYGIPWETYKFHYEVTPASNITTRHNEQYWLKVAGSSPYNLSNRDLLLA